jgi:hypothetical protein
MLRMAEYEWNSVQTTASHKLAYMKNAQNKSDLRLSSFASTGAEKMLSEACRIGVGLSHGERLKQVLWGNAPNTSFGVQNKKPPRENKDTKKRNRDSANDTAVGEGGPPPKTFRTASSMKQSLLQLSGSARKQPTPAAARQALTSSVADLDFEEENNE